ncbi:MAG: hypothetical protein HOP19_17580 [Acidobacteria bacterium]|nr:hypothetical protein [Acidobacteriota bacterium]
MKELIVDADWQILCELHPIAVDRFPQRLLERHRDQDIVERIFPDFRRSDGLARLVNLRDMNLITDEEFALFSEGVRQWIEELIYTQRNQFRL